jgi:tetratricopeptide (TPR) repeat protein
MGAAQYPLSRTVPTTSTPIGTEGETPADLFALARKLIREGHVDEAVMALDRAIEIAPEKSDGWRQKALVLRQLGRVNDAIGVIDAGLLRIGRDDPSLLTEKAELHLLDDDFIAASEAFERLIALEPGGIDHWLGKGRSLLSGGKAGSALDCAERVLQLDPLSAKGQVLRGDALVALERWAESFAAFAAAAETDPGQFGSSSWAARGDQYQGNQQSELALEAYDRATRDTTNPEGWYGIGVIRRARGDVEGALDAFARASEADNQFISGFLDAGTLCVDHDQLDRALRYFERATLLRLDDKTLIERRDVRPWVAIGGVHERRRNYKEARDAYEQATRIDPEDAEAWNFLGNALAHLDHIEEAVRSYQSAIEIRPNFGWPYYNLAFALLRLSRFDEALQSVNRAIEIEPQNGNFWVCKLTVLSACDRVDEAAIDQALAATRSDDALRIAACGYLADNDRLGRAREILRGIEPAAIRDPETRLSLAENLLLVGDSGVAADVLADIDASVLHPNLAIVRALLHLLAARLADGAALSESLFWDFLGRLKTRIAESEKRGGKWGYLRIGWNFKGARRLVLRSELALADKFVLAALIDLAEAKVRLSDLSFITEMRAPA